MIKSHLRFLILTPEIVTDFIFTAIIIIIVIVINHYRLIFVFELSFSLSLLLSLLLTGAGDYIQRFLCICSIFPQSAFEYLPVAPVERLPLGGNVGCNHGVSTLQVVSKICIWSQMSSGAELLALRVVIRKEWIRRSLIGCVVGVSCYFALK